MALQFLQQAMSFYEELHDISSRALCLQHIGSNPLHPSIASASPCYCGLLGAIGKLTDGLCGVADRCMGGWATRKKACAPLRRA